jgi:hypothetical protein
VRTQYARLIELQRKGRHDSVANASGVGGTSLSGGQGPLRVSTLRSQSNRVSVCTCVSARVDIRARARVCVFV